MKHLSFLRAAGLLAGLLLAQASPAAAQAPAWQSARAVAAATAAAASTYSEVTATAVDAAGNVYLAGSFRNSVVLGGTTLTSRGGQDIFVAKFSPVSNQVLWAQGAGGTGNDGADALAVSGTSVYVAGSFSSATADFGPVILTKVSPGGATDVFVAKLTDAGPTGSFVWAQRAGGSYYNRGYALAVSGTSVYVAGNFSAAAGSSAAADFGPVILTNMSIAGYTDMFVAKLTDAGPTGSFVWAQRGGGFLGEAATALAVSGTSVYVTGWFQSNSADFGTTTLTNSSLYNVFVAKLTDAGSSGSFVWAQGAGAIRSYPRAVAASGTSVYVAGSFRGVMTGFGGLSLTSVGGEEAFVAKLTDTGPTASFTWAQRAGGPGDDQVNALAVSGTSVYVAGRFLSHVASFGPTTFANSVLGGGTADVFAAKLTDAGPTGSFVWAQRAGGTGIDEATALAVSGTSVYVAGSFIGSAAVFGASTLTNPNPNTYLGFLASLTDPTLTATATAGPREPAALFPNPARGTATLRLPAGTPSAPLTLTDALGRAVRCYPAPAGPETALDLGGLPAGLYLLRGAGPARRLAVE